MKVETYKVATSDGLQLHCINWTPEGPPIATLTFIHGYGEYIERYSHVFPSFAEAGIKVQSFDQRGHGKSEGVRGHSPSLEQSLADISLITAKADPALPHFLYGHSLGGGFTLVYASKYPDKFTGIIASDPLIRLALNVPYLKVLGGRLASKIVPTMRMHNEINVNDLTRDPKLNEEYGRDPQVIHDITVKMGSIVLDLGDAVFEGSSKITKPILIAHGTADKLTSYDASKEFIAKVSSTDKTFKSLEGWYHEPHNEPEKEEFIKMVLDWVLQHL